MNDSLHKAIFARLPPPTAEAQLSEDARGDLGTTINDAVAMARSNDPMCQWPMEMEQVGLDFGADVPPSVNGFQQGLPQVAVASRTGLVSGVNLWDLHKLFDTVDPCVLVDCAKTLAYTAADLKLAMKYIRGRLTGNPSARGSNGVQEKS